MHVAAAAEQAHRRWRRRCRARPPTAHGDPLAAPPAEQDAQWRFRRRHRGRIENMVDDLRRRDVDVIVDVPRGPIGAIEEMLMLGTAREALRDVREHACAEHVSSRCPTSAFASCSRSPTTAAAKNLDARQRGAAAAASDCDFSATSHRRRGDVTRPFQPDAGTWSPRDGGATRSASSSPMTTPVIRLGLVGLLTALATSK